MPVATPFLNLTEDQARELYRLARTYQREARRCEEAKAYLAGCIMLGASLETMLKLIVYVYEDEAAATGKVPTIYKKNLAKQVPKPLLKWSLEEMLNVVTAAGWLPSEANVNGDWNKHGAKIGDWAKFAQRVRNLVHPGAWTRDHFGRRVTAGIFRTQREVVDLCKDWLIYHNNKRLRTDLRRKVKA
jgi:hypothetical protein